MAESEEPRRFPSPPPGAPLPRLWKTEPDPVVEEDEEDEDEEELDAYGNPIVKKDKDKDRGKSRAKEKDKPRDKSAGPGASQPKAKAKADAVAPAKPDKPKKKSTGAPIDRGPTPVSKPVSRDKPAKVARGADRSKERGEAGKLIEETPKLDTYEARQKARLLIGVALVGIFVMIGFVIYNSLPTRQAEKEALPDEGHVVVQPQAAPPFDVVRLEQEARGLLDRARDAAKRGKTELAVALLTKITEAYPKTQSAGEARAALARPAQNLPLFVDRPVIVALAPATDAPGTATAPNVPRPVVDATKVVPPAEAEGDAKLSLPANSAEPAYAANVNTVKGQPDLPSKPLPTGFFKRPGTGTHASGWPVEIIGERDGAPMVLVPGDTFIMGRDGGPPEEAPAHKVALGAYYIDQHEVTIRQFDLFQKEAGVRSERARALQKEKEKNKDAKSREEESEDSPVVMVSARDAKDYATWAKKQLPTEAQWEMAARSTDGRLYPRGNEPPQWERPRRSRQIDPIRSFPSDVSPYGVSDLAGNAWEWTKDWYDPKYYQQFKTTTADNPTGPDRPASRQLTIRGSGKQGMLTKREGMKWDVRLPYLGFRCVLQVEGAGNALEPATAAGAPGRPATAPGVIPF